MRRRLPLYGRCDVNSKCFDSRPITALCKRLRAHSDADWCSVSGHIFKYELKMWLGLWKCIANGHHLMVGMGKNRENNGPYYCWQCFYKYPNQRKLRNWLGSLIKESP